MRQLGGHEYNRISFYIVAHADDWQLFMQPNIYKDFITPRCKVVIIIVTAGDSGRSSIFWKAREEGSKSSIRYCLAPVSNLIECSGTTQFNSQHIAYSIINNVTSYFLRLPDGNIDGCGFPEYNLQSLAQFRRNKIGSIHAVDGSAVYRSCADLAGLLETILIYESATFDNIQINYPNPDMVKNHGDHIDHIIVGECIQNISIPSNSVQFLFNGYSLKSAKKMLHSAELFWKIGMFAAYEKTVYDICGYSTLAEDPEIYRSWCTASANFQILRPLPP